MNTITINVPDEIKIEAEAAAKSVNLSLPDFAQLALAQTLARALTDPFLEERASRATGEGWEALKKFIPDAPPISGDELP